MQKTLRTLLVSACLAVALEAKAQWTTQTIPLHGGWNAVFLEVQPDPAECDTVFAGLPVESVWAYNRHHAPVQFIQDPATLVPGNPDWLTWLPLQNAAAASTVNLFAVEGRRAYVVKLADNAGSLNWNIKGRPVVKPATWLQDSLNLVGFSVAPGAGPSFQNFFAGSPAHINQPVFRLTAQGQWTKITLPASTFVNSGEAYWISCVSPSTYSGPLMPDTGLRTGLDYGRSVVEHTLKIKNASTTARVFTLTRLPSETPGGGGNAPLAGDVPLAYFKMNLANSEYGWVPLAATLQSPSIPAGQEWELRIAVQRNLMAPSNDPQAKFQSLIQVTDGAGTRWLVPVSAYGLKGDPSTSTSEFQAAGETPHARAGLWVGMVALNKVSQPSAISDPTTPQPTDSQAQFRILVHVNNDGQPAFLQRILQMWKNGTTKPDPNDPGKVVVDVPGRYVLLTDESLAPNYTGAALRDGQPVGRRISSAAFAFRNPIPLSGAGEFGANTVSCAVNLDYNDPLNPFKHKFHPDHNNLDEHYTQTLPDGAESFSVQRVVQLEFQANDPNGFQFPGWGDMQLGGKYRETITGIHRNPIYVEGTFRLFQASRVGVLNDAN
ncbi:MAG TPA: hypothetical protein VJS65_12765 [Verrucomicrobiae bacterium]|nr:hypothetical protein [Verrucomicrobiae bacterium]